MLLAALSSGAARQTPVVLLVEDHDDTRLMYAEFLRVTFDVREAADGHRALAVLQDVRPDLLITDISLPGIDGFELISMIRNDPISGSIPIICLSGYGGQALEQRARAAGCDRILQKPCMPDELAATASKLLRELQDRTTRP
jgi:CheY-like chemotaxis protein